LSNSIRNGQIISLEVAQVIKGRNTRLFTIKDSFKLLPSALAKLASDFKVEQQKEHFPHYFLLESLKETMEYVGHLPPYEFFEPKRTSKADWEEMAANVGNTWSLMEVARSYLHSDCVALYQVLVAFFRELKAQFSLNPIENLSIPALVWPLRLGSNTSYPFFVRMLSKSMTCPRTWMVISGQLTMEVLLTSIGPTLPREVITMTSTPFTPRLCVAQCR
jgi:hypothetical protein